MRPLREMGGRGMGRLFQNRIDSHRGKEASGEHVDAQGERIAVLMPTVDAPCGVCDDHEDVDDDCCALGEFHIGGVRYIRGGRWQGVSR